MMDDILKLIKAGEVSGVQFKERILDKYDIACELVAFRIFLFNNAIYLLPYTGVGSGITRALDENINVTFMNNDKAHEFVIKVWREESNEVEEKSNQVEDLDTRLRYSDTDLGTFESDLDTRLRHSDTDLDTSVSDLYDRLRHSDTPKVSLSNKQRDIVNFCSVPRTTKEILERIGVSMHSKNRERYITSLVAAGYLQMIILIILRQATRNTRK